MKKSFAIFLSLLLLTSLVMNPISILANQKLDEESDISKIITIKTTEDIEYDGLIVSKDTLLFVEQDKENQYLLPINFGENKEYLKLSEDKFELVEETSQTRIPIEDLIELGQRNYSLDKTFTTEVEGEIVRVIDAEVTMLTYGYEGSEGLYIGYKFFSSDASQNQDSEKNDEALEENDSIEQNGDESLNGEDSLEEENDTISVEEENTEKENNVEENVADNNQTDEVINHTEETSDTEKTNEATANEKESSESSDTINSQNEAQTMSIQSAESVDPWKDSNAKFFEVTTDSLSVYDNRSGKLIEIGTLIKGQSYPIYSDYGNWHRIKFGSYFGYVHKGSTIPSDGKSVLNVNKTYSNQQRSISALQDVSVFDNTSGSLVEFGELKENASISIAADYGNWWRVIYADRVGYINKTGVKTNFNKGDEFFKVLTNDAPVYDNRTGKLIHVGNLIKGQTYPIDRDYGNWWGIQYNNHYVYIHKGYTEYSTNNLKNLSNNINTIARKFTAINDLPVYDNSTGKLIEFGLIREGQQYQITRDYGNWWEIVFADRVGYVAKSKVQTSFLSTDHYFTALDDATIYDNRSGNLVKVGELVQGQDYQIVSNYGNWWRIRFANFYGYVHKSSTGAVTKPTINNKNDNRFTNSDLAITTNTEAIIYDNSSGKLVPFGVIDEDVNYPIVSEYGPNWFRIIFNNRIGYISKSVAESYKVTNYDYSLSDMVAKQMTVNPQTDKYRNSPIWVHSSNLSVSGSTVRLKGKISGDGVNIRTSPSTSSSVAESSVARNTEFVYLGSVKGTSVSGSTTWYKINIGDKKNVYVHSSLADIRVPYYESPSTSSHKYGTTSFVSTTVRNESGEWYQLGLTITWRDAKTSDVEQYVNPEKQDLFQFLVLSDSVNQTASQFNKVLQGQGVLQNRGQAYIDAGNKYNINEIYLISHSLLETGNGTSQLARGVEVGKTSLGLPTLVTSSNRGSLRDIKVVYNMYGIGANDNCALSCGATYAYNNGWTSIDKAIIEGAAFVSNNYFARGQNTLYKMRWNPASPGTKQYATDVAWASKQIARFKELYEQLDNPTMSFDVPNFK